MSTPAITDHVDQPPAAGSAGRREALSRRTVIVSTDLPPVRIVAAIIGLVLAALAMDLPAATLALFSAGTANPGNAVQAGTVRLAADGGGGPAFTIPALVPGESVDRAIGITSTGTGDARLDLAVLPESSGALVTDPATGLALSVDRCLNGIWATTTPVTGVATPPSGGAVLACAATPGAVPSVQAIYHGPIVARGLTGPGTPTATPQVIPGIDRLAAGGRAEFRLRASLPTVAPGATAPTGQQGAVTFEWRATGLGTNLGGTPLAAPPATPVTATPGPVAPIVPPVATAVPVAPTAFPLPTSTAVPAPTATFPAYAGAALALDGVADAVQVGWTAQVGPLSGRPDWTLEAWVNPADLSTSRVLYAEADATGDVLAIRVVPGTAGATRLEVGLRHAGTLEWSGADLPAGAVATGTWSHLAVAFDEGARLDLAANGVIVSSLGTAAATTRPSATATVARLARPAAATTGSPFAGAIDEVRAWSVARTYVAADVTYRQKLVGVEAGLVLHFPMGAYGAGGTDARGLTLADQSPSALVGTLLEGVQWTASRAPVDRPATPLNLGLTSATDSGTSQGDGITNRTAVVVTGRAAAGSVVTLAVNGATVAGATATTPASGTFEIPVTLATGSSAITAAATDGALAPSMASVALTVSVDATAPTPGTLAPVGATGSAQAGYAVTTTTPTVALAGADDTGHAGAALATVQLEVATGAGATTGFVASGQAVAPAGGAASFPTGTLADGAYTFRAAVVDVAGNVAYTPAVTVTVSTVPVVPLAVLVAAEDAATWNAPRFVVPTPPAGANAIQSVQVQAGAASSGPFTDHGAPVTTPTGNDWVVQGPAVTGTRWVRAVVTDTGGGSATTAPLRVTAWSGAVADADWTVSGHASQSNGWLVLTPNQSDKKGGAYLEVPVPTTGPVTVSFDLVVDGNADGICVPFFTSPDAFLQSDPGGGPLGCIGMPGTYFVGIQEYGTDSVKIGTPTDRVFTETPIFGLSNDSTNRVTISLAPTGGATTVAVRAQYQSATPVVIATGSLAGTLPAAGTLVGLTGATGGESAIHKVRNIVVTGS